MFSAQHFPGPRSRAGLDLAAASRCRNTSRVSQVAGECVMKVILTGCTGLVGSEVLRQLADDPAVTKVTCLVRRPVEIESPKVESVVLDDFTQYNDELVAKLSDHSASGRRAGRSAHRRRRSPLRYDPAVLSNSDIKHLARATAKTR